MSGPAPEPARPTVLGLQTGVVDEFDVDRGLGVVANGVGRWAFHCTALTDGTRRIDPGTSVAFVVGPGGPGRWEAFEVTPLRSGGRPAVPATA